MLVITTSKGIAFALTDPPDGLAAMLTRYDELLSEAELAILYIIQPGDRLADLEKVRGRPFEHWEFIAKEGGWFEVVFVLSDDGFGHVVFVPEREDIDFGLIHLCKANLSDF